MGSKTRILSFRVTSPVTSLTANAHILSTATAFKQGLSFIGGTPATGYVKWIQFNAFDCSRPVIWFIVRIYTLRITVYESETDSIPIFNDYVWNMQLIRIKVYRGIRGRLNNCLMGLDKMGANKFLRMHSVGAKCKRIRKLADRWYINANWRSIISILPVFFISSYSSFPISLMINIEI